MIKEISVHHLRASNNVEEKHNFQGGYNKDETQRQAFRQTLPWPNNLTHKTVFQKVQNFLVCVIKTRLDK